jgi:hypothetical protein
MRFRDSVGASFARLGRSIVSSLIFCARLAIDTLQSDYPRIAESAATRKAAAVTRKKTSPSVAPNAAAMSWALFSRWSRSPCSACDASLQSPDFPDLFLAVLAKSFHRALPSHGAAFMMIQPDHVPKLMPCGIADVPSHQHNQSFILGLAVLGTRLFQTMDLRIDQNSLRRKEW